MNKKTKKYSGVIVPMITPVDEQFQIDKVAVEKLVDSFALSKVDPFILGTTGESFSVSEKDKDVFVETTAKANRGIGTLYVGISGNCVSESKASAERYANLGADVLVAHQPFYYPMSDEQLLNYFNDLADTVKLPLILYNNPITTKQSISLEVIDQLSYHSNIYGFKDSERGEERLNKAISLWKDREDFSHLLGWAAKSAYSILNGSDGIIPSTGNLTPKLYRDLYDAAIKGDEKLALELQNTADDISAIYQQGRTINQSIPALKAMLEVKGLCKSIALPPMFSASSNEKAEIVKAMKVMGI